MSLRNPHLILYYPDGNVEHVNEFHCDKVDFSVVDGKIYVRQWNIFSPDYFEYSDIFIVLSTVTKDVLSRTLLDRSTYFLRGYRETPACMFNQYERLRQQKIEMLSCVLPDGDGSLRVRVKSFLWIN